MPKLGTLSLQAMDDTDLFFTEDVFPDGQREMAEIETDIEEPSFDANSVWVSGHVPGVHSVNVEGDTSIIYGWFRGDSIYVPFRLSIYILCEEVEELCEEEDV